MSDDDGMIESFCTAVQRIADNISQAQYGRAFDDLPEIMKVLVWRDAEEMHKDSLGD